MQYALVRLAVPGKDGEDSSTRDVFVHWIERSVPLRERAINERYIEEVRGYLKPFHASIVATCSERINLHR
jgi:hypothetical protein